MGLMGKTIILIILIILSILIILIIPSIPIIPTTHPHTSAPPFLILEEQICA